MAEGNVMAYIMQQELKYRKCILDCLLIKLRKKSDLEQDTEDETGQFKMPFYQLIYIRTVANVFLNTYF